MDWTCGSGTQSLEGRQGLAQGIGREHRETVIQKKKKNKKNRGGGFEGGGEEDWILRGENLTIITKVIMAGFY